jgi:hypothetical protein
MATEPKNQRLTERHRRVLEVLAIAPHGRDVNALLTLGFKLETMADLVRSELATVRIETVEKLDSKIEVALVQITDAGWQLLEGLTCGNGRHIRQKTDERPFGPGTGRRGRRWIPVGDCRMCLTRP